MMDGSSNFTLDNAIAQLVEGPFNCLCLICSSICEEISSNRQTIRQLEQNIEELQQKVLSVIKLSSALAAEQETGQNSEEDQNLVGDISAGIESHLKTVRMVRECLVTKEKTMTVMMISSTDPEMDVNLNAVQVKSESEEVESLLDVTSNKDYTSETEDSSGSDSNLSDVDLPNDNGENESSLDNDDLDKKHTLLPTKKEEKRTLRVFKTEINEDENSSSIQSTSKSEIGDSCQDQEDTSSQDSSLSGDDEDFKLKKSSSRTKHKCNTCGVILASLPNLKVHIRCVHHKGLVPYVCEHCGKAYKRKPDLTIHMRKHTGDRPYTCKICSEAFARLSSLRIHESKHKNKLIDQNGRKVTKSEDGNEPQAETRTYICQICPASFHRQLSLTHHMIRIHSNEPISGKVYECTDCKRKFVGNYELQRHRKKAHVAGEHVCEKCGCSFAKELVLRLHLRKCGKKVTPTWTKENGKFYFRDMEVQTNTENRYVCPFISCEKSFKRKDALTEHFKNRHDQLRTVKEHQCDQCGKEYVLKSTLLQHIKGVHDGGHVCDICGTTRTTKKYLDLHKRVDHQGIRPYSCVHCGKSYAEKSQLVIHERHHSGERPYACHLCGRTFIKYTNLRLHIQSLHSDVVTSSEDMAKSNK